MASGALSNSRPSAQGVEPRQIECNASPISCHNHCSNSITKRPRSSSNHRSRSMAKLWMELLQAGKHTTILMPLFCLCGKDSRRIYMTNGKLDYTSSSMASRLLEVTCQNLMIDLKSNRESYFIKVMRLGLSSIGELFYQSTILVKRSGMLEKLLS